MPFYTVLLLLIPSVCAFPRASNPLPVVPTTSHRVTAKLVDLVIELGEANLVVVKLCNVFIQCVLLNITTGLVEQLGVRLISSLKFKTCHLIEINF